MKSLTKERIEEILSVTSEDRTELRTLCSMALQQGITQEQLEKFQESVATLTLEVEGARQANEAHLRTQSIQAAAIRRYLLKLKVAQDALLEIRWKPQLGGTWEVAQKALDVIGELTDPLPPDEWQKTIEDACIVSFIEPVGTPGELLNKIIALETQIALDPAVSSDAAKLRDTYKLAFGEFVFNVGQSEGVWFNDNPEVIRLATECEAAYIEQAPHAKWCGAPSSSGSQVYECKCWKSQVKRNANGTTTGTASSDT